MNNALTNPLNNAKKSAALVVSSLSNASKFNPEVYRQHAVFVKHVDEIVMDIIKKTPVLFSIFSDQEGWKKAVLNVMGFRTSEVKALDRWDKEWYSFAHDRGAGNSYPIVTELDGSTLNPKRLVEIGFTAEQINCTYTINGVSAFPTPMKEVCNAVEKGLHTMFSEKLAVGRRLWLVDGQGGVGPSRLTLNNTFTDCNLKPRSDCNSSRRRIVGTSRRRSGRRKPTLRSRWASRTSKMDCRRT